VSPVSNPISVGMVPSIGLVLKYLSVS